MQQRSWGGLGTLGRGRGPEEGKGSDPRKVMDPRKEVQKKPGEHKEPLLSWAQLIWLSDLQGQHLRQAPQCLRR